jgi:hypothetical protein
LLPFFAVVVALGCILASVKRLRMAVAPTKLDPRPIVDALKGDAGKANLPALREAILEEPDAEWEHELVHAMAASGDERTGRVNELLTELDHTVQGWARVPRVCASIAASTGFLLASLALRNGLSVAEDLPQEIQDMAIRAAVKDGIDVAALGLCGAIACITIGHNAAKAAKGRLKATDELVERLEKLTESESESESGSAPDS